jgi:hypothetical protein
MTMQHSVKSQAGGDVTLLKERRKPGRPLSCRVCTALIPILLIGCECSRSPVQSHSANTFRTLQTDFLSPPDQFRFVSHWIWNGPVTENEIQFQIREFSDKGIRTLIISAADGTPPQLSAAKLTADSLGVLIVDDSFLQFDPEMPGIDLWAAEPRVLASGCTALKLAAGRARQAGEKWVLIDMGQIQSDLSFHSLIRGINQAAACGANRFVLESRFHLLDDSVRNSLSFSYHLPWWELFTNVSDYFARLIMALSFGEPVRPVLVVLPDLTEGLNEAESSVFLMLKQLESTVEYDLIHPGQLKDVKIRRNALVIGAAEYQQLILLPGAGLPHESSALIDEFMKSAGPEKVLNWPPSLPDSTSTSVERQTGSGSEIRLSEPLAALNGELSRTFRIILHEGRQGLCHQRRQLSDGQLIYLFNSADEPVSGELICAGQALYHLDCLKGRISRIASSKTENGIQASFGLKPGENLIYFSAAQDSFGITPQEEPSSLHETLVQPQSVPRVMPVYYNSWNWMEAEKSEVFKLVKPAQFSFEWPNQADPASLMIVADCMSNELTVNNVPVQPIPDAWLLDRAFSVYSIGDAVRSGMNHVQILSCGRSNGLIGIFGDFLLRRSGMEFKIRPPQPLPFHGWKTEMPFYSDAVSTIQTYEIHRESGKYFIRLGKWSGIAAEVLVNESPGGLVIAEEETDVTGLLRDGWNDVSVVVYGSPDHFFREINKIKGVEPPRTFGLDEPFQCVHVTAH